MKFLKILTIGLSTSFLFILGISIPQNQYAIYAAADPVPKEWAAECQRRNIFNGCTCKCETTTKEIMLYDFGKGEIREKKPSDSALPLGAMKFFAYDYLPDSAGDYLRCTVKVDVNHRCTETYSASKTSTDRISSDFVLFPALKDGIIQIDQNGQVKWDVSLRNIGSLTFSAMAVVSLVFGLFGAFKVSTAGSDADQATLGRKYVKNALIGFTVSIVGIVAVAALASMLGIKASVSTLETELTPSSAPNLDSDFLRKLFNVT